MTEERFERDEFGRMELGRRAFIKKLVIGAAFTAPIVASWDLVNSTGASGAFSPGAGEGGSAATTSTTFSSNGTNSGGPVTPKNKKTKTKPPKNKP